jgi:multidrug transporter EmrE-like cation transporter
VNAGSINALWSGILFVIYIITSCLGLYLIKAATHWKTVSFGTGFILYGMGAVLWMIILRFMPLSFAFPIAAGSLVIGTLLTGVIFLKEAVSTGHIFGSLIIILGIFVIANNR